MKGRFKGADIAKLHKHGSPMVIFVYSPGCGHCRNYEPEWNSHYDTFPEYSRNHKDIKTPSIGSISFEELRNIIPLQVHYKNKPRELRDTIDFVPQMFSIDENGTMDSIPNIHNFDGIGKILREMKIMSGGYLHNSNSLVKTADTSNPLNSSIKVSIIKKSKKKKRKRRKRRKSKRKRRQSIKL